MATLTREQQQVLSALLAAGRSIKDPRTRRVYERAATQTGLVEQGLRNQRGGDADSSNWRQERESGYGDEWAKTGGPLNLTASAGRFRDEFLQHYSPGEKSYDVAAQVQRPAAQYRGRYKDVAGQAAAILREYSGGGSDSASSVEAPAGQGSAAPQGGQVDPSALLQLLSPQQRQAPASSAALPTPAALPDAYRSLSSGGAPKPRQDIGALAAMVQAKGPAPSLAAAAAPQTAATEQAGAEGGLGGIVSEMDRIDGAKVPYLWGGGHGAKQAPGSKVTPLDCSGAVARALGVNPMVSGEFAKWGEGGKGKKVTIYANGEHVLMHVRGRGFWGTSKSNPGGGAGWIPAESVSKDYLSRFTARHPPGL